LPISFPAKIEGWTIDSDAAVGFNVERSTNGVSYSDISSSGDPQAFGAGETVSASPPVGWSALVIAAGDILRITKTGGAATNATLSINMRKQ